MVVRFSHLKIGSCIGQFLYQELFLRCTISMCPIYSRQGISENLLQYVLLYQSFVVGLNMDLTTFDHHGQVKDSLMFHNIHEKLILAFIAESCTVCINLEIIFKILFIIPM